MFPHLYALEKLSNAVRILATGEGDVRSRILPASMELLPLTPEHLPVALRDDYRWVIKQLEKRKPLNESERHEWATDGTIQANLRRMSNRAGSRIAEKICDLQYHVQDAYQVYRESLQKNQN